MVVAVICHAKGAGSVQPYVGDGIPTSRSVYHCQTIIHLALEGDVRLVRLRVHRHPGGPDAYAGDQSALGVGIDVGLGVCSDRAHIFGAGTGDIRGTCVAVDSDPSGAIQATEALDDSVRLRVDDDQFTGSFVSDVDKVVGRVVGNVVRLCESGDGVDDGGALQNRDGTRLVIGNEYFVRFVRRAAVRVLPKGD